MGENNWEGLLDPLDKDLRELIIHYGEMAQAAYDTFIRDKYSKYAGPNLILPPFQNIYFIWFYRRCLLFYIFNRVFNNKKKQETCYIVKSKNTLTMNFFIYLF